MSLERFRSAAENHDPDLLASAFAEDAVFRSPVGHTPHEGRAKCVEFVNRALGVFEDFEYLDECRSERSATLIFRTKIGGLEAQGLDYLTFNESGEVESLTVMLRPLNAVAEMRERMAAAIEAEAAAGG